MLASHGNTRFTISQIEEAVGHAFAGFDQVLVAAEDDLPRRPGVLLAGHGAEELRLESHLLI